MPLFQADIYSNCLNKSVPVNIVLPADSRGKLPVLVLLHGMTDDASCWQRRSSVERYADETGIAVVMPDGGLSWYCDTPFGERYYQFISEELLQTVRRIFPRLSADRAASYVGGISMGGFGALKCAFDRTDCFSAAVCLSGALDPRRFSSLIDPATAGAFRWEEVFGPLSQIEDSVNDLYKQARCSDPERLRIYMWCGTDDSLLAMSRDMHACLSDYHDRLLYRETPGGHDWQLWDRELKLAMHWLAEGRQ